MKFNLPRNDYRIIYADPPWSYYGDPNKDQAAGKHYSLMSTEAISALPVCNFITRPAACFLWVTGPRLPEAITVMEKWGFYYRGVAYVWVKTRKDGGIIGGQGVRPTFTKPTTEFVLVGTTCKVGRPFPIYTESQWQVVLAPRRAHSEKPIIIRNNIVDLCGNLPRLEMFSRHEVSGWDNWGNQKGRLI